jgi:hypothetical protein
MVSKMKPPFALRRSSYPPSVLEKDVPKMEELELSSYNARYRVILVLCVELFEQWLSIQPVVSDAIGTRSGFLPRTICSVFIQGEYEHTFLLVVTSLNRDRPDKAITRHKVSSLGNYSCVLSANISIGFLVVFLSITDE